MQPLDTQQTGATPSRIAYRFERLWLTPVFRALVRTGLPAVAILGAGTWYLSDLDHVDAFKSKLLEIRSNIENRPEFMVNLMRIETASDEVADGVREVTALDFPISSFDLDLSALRARIEELDAVERADLVIRKGGILTVSLSERAPAFVWRTRDGLELIDADGNRVAALDSRIMRADLPLIAGDGAERATDEARALFMAIKPVSGRVRGLMRVGARRWDVILNNEQRIMLPEQNPVAALERVLAINRITDLLSRDLSIVDMRNPARPVLRLNNAAVEALHSPGPGANGKDDTL
ncbi:MAG: cell division protein FtsQ/DivIB [Paracoccaceae bacterium]